MEKTVLPKEPDQVEEQPVHAPTTSLDSAGPKTDTNLPPPVQDSDDTPSQHEDKDLRVFPSSVNQLIPDQPVRVSTSATVVLDNTPDVQHRNRFVFTSNLMAYMIVLLPVTFAAYVSTVWSANGPRSNEESSGNASYITTLVRLDSPFCPQKVPKSPLQLTSVIVRPDVSFPFRLPISSTRARDSDRIP